MALDIAVPTPPDLTNRPLPDAVVAEPPESAGDLRREDLEEILADGAWHDGVEEWAQYTDLSAADVDLLAAAGSFEAFDFFWDPGAERLRYDTPDAPADWADHDEASVPADLVASELDELGRTVAETIAADYVDWGDEESSDLVWGVGSFGQMPTLEDE